MKNFQSRRFCVTVIALALLPTTGLPQSLWRDNLSKPMFSDKRAAAVGDILTIVIKQSTTASKNNKTDTSRTSSMDASLTSFLYPGASKLLTSGGQMPSMGFGSKGSYTGGGTINNSETIVDQEAVRVIDILPNKCLVIEGKRDTEFSGEKQTAVIRGVVRSEDVLANNTVYSYNVADATIQIISKGTITDSQKKGWFHTIWDKVSPF